MEGRVKGAATRARAGHKNERERTCKTNRKDRVVEFRKVLPQLSPPARKPLARVRKPNLYSDRGQDSNPCAWRSFGPQSTHGSTVKVNVDKV
ncbi:hypothetical protein E2C01_039296 [Portunus trituberculatus]|uniref:Uncharacterized protein n=1 Tax=Portunus trituberculatus TaxID=210409 RepID=A0A5B7FGG7_PORTR|nr:hypothetical protein [Portunus trituberculatus]